MHLNSGLRLSCCKALLYLSFPPPRVVAAATDTNISYLRHVRQPAWLILPFHHLVLIHYWDPRSVFFGTSMTFTYRNKLPRTGMLRQKYGREIKDTTQLCSPVCNDLWRICSLALLLPCSAKARSSGVSISREYSGGTST